MSMTTNAETPRRLVDMEFRPGDLPPADNRAFKKKERTEKEIEEDTARFDEARKLRQNTKKEEIEKLHNQNISKIQENAKKRQSFRF